MVITHHDTLLFHRSLPLSSVENLPSTVTSMQPASVSSVMSPNFYPPGRTPMDMLQSPASVMSLHPKSVPGGKCYTSVISDSLLSWVTNRVVIHISGLVRVTGLETC